jgi:hypothetical protein
MRARILLAPTPCGPMAEPAPSTTVVFTADAGRYRLQVDYHPAIVGRLKTVVPAPMRRWVPRKQLLEPGCCIGGYWEVSAEWAGPLAVAFREAGLDVRGLGHADIADWFAAFCAPVPTGKAGHRAYTAGLCANCTTADHRPGGVECEHCYHQRLIHQYRVMAALAKAQAPHPKVVASAGAALTCRYPLLATGTEGGIEERDRTVVLDILIEAEHDRSPSKCPICGRRPTKGTVTHATCRARLMHAVVDRPLTKTRNKAFQDSLCTVCITRPQLPGRLVTCARCAKFIDAAKALHVGDADR